MKKTKKLSAVSLRVEGVVAEISCKSEQNYGLILYRFIVAVARAVLVLVRSNICNRRNNGVKCRSSGSNSINDSSDYPDSHHHDL